jgi:hypothetical protein
MDFSTGKYDSNTKIFTSEKGPNYYIRQDDCLNQALSETCNMEPCGWSEWKEDITENKINNCKFPCSNYSYREYSTCPSKTCDKDRSSFKIRYQKCGPTPCATKKITNYGNCDKTCGGGKRTRSCEIHPDEEMYNLPKTYEIGKEYVLTPPAWVAQTATIAANAIAKATSLITQNSGSSPTTSTNSSGNLVPVPITSTKSTGPTGIPTVSKFQPYNINTGYRRMPLPAYEDYLTGPYDSRF